MPISIVQLLIVGVLLAIWYRVFRHLRAKAKREQETRREAAQRQGNSYEEEPKPHAVLVESEPVTSNVVEFAAEDNTEKECSKPVPTGVTGIVQTARKRLRCTEYDDNGDLLTEVCRVDRYGHVIGKTKVQSGSFRDVAASLVRAA